MALVTKDMNIMEVVEKYPVVVEVFQRHGLGCVGCMIASGESLGEGIASHGFDPDEILAEINKLIEAQ
ncbi:MAG: disulfide oxidoreductase [Fusobacteriales bacterium]|nr:MAG: disulfide oxidoreductase [Fusobacteriales bacterium]